MESAYTSSEQAKEQLLDAILPHVPFDGWSETSFKAAISDSGLDAAMARGLCPRGAVNLALALHERGDRDMVRRLKLANLGDMRFRDRVAFAVKTRMESEADKEAVRRGATLFALPTYAPDGARAAWGTADLIWNTLGDGSDDINWYTKRAILAGVYSSTLLFWLGDDSPEQERTWQFLDRRIDDVMQIEKVKASVNGNALLRPFLAGPKWALGLIKAPSRIHPGDLPGGLRGRR